MGDFSPVEIRSRIDTLNQQLEAILCPTRFTLNNLVVEITQEIKDIQDKCIHNFEDGYCIYCDKKETQ